jgi:hypothetical protein
MFLREHHRPPELPGRLDERRFEEHQISVQQPGLLVSRAVAAVTAVVDRSSVDRRFLEEVDMRGRWMHWRFGAALLLSAACAGIGEASEPLAADLLADWESQKARIVDLAEAMPAEKYDFKPTPAQMTFAEQMVHLAEAHVRQLARLDPAGRVRAPVPANGQTKDEVVRFVAAAYDYGTAVLRANQGALLEPAGDRTGARAVWAAMMNAQNHYGQGAVYLRLSGIVPPASRDRQHHHE